MGMINKLELEKFAMQIREQLGIDPSIILNPNYLEELKLKIVQHFEWFKIESIREDGYKGSFLVLDNKIYFTIYLSGGIENQFYDLINIFSFALLLDKKSLTEYELNHKVFGFPRFTNNYHADDYLARAIMMPRKAFLSYLVQYSSGDGSTLYMSKMQCEVNKYCYARARDLEIC